jgi:preprotein translocase subunit SecE
MGLTQYLKDTRGELRHVAWPTRVQTIVFTTLVIVVSILVSLYLGFFDYLLTTGLGKVIGAFQGATPVVDQPIISTSTSDLIISTTSSQ